MYLFFKASNELICYCSVCFSLDRQNPGRFFYFKEGLGGSSLHQSDVAGCYNLDQINSE